MNFIKNQSESKIPPKFKIMKIFLFSLCLLPLLLLADGTPKIPEVFNINLDLPPSERFKEVVIAKKSGLLAFKNALVDIVQVPDYIITALGYYEQLVYSHENCYEELLGVAKYSELTFGEVFLINFIYEIFASCTSIISINSEGHIIHSRNLDYVFKDILANLTVRFKFWRNGTLLYEGDGEAGYLGLVTGLRHNGFGVSINERKKGDPLLTIYEVLFKKTFSVPYFIRKVLENAETFDQAVEMFSKEEFGAPCYLIVSGVNKDEGVVITRDRYGVNNISRIDTMVKDQWFIVQTNYDRNLPDPASDYRRIPAEMKMKALGRDGANETSIFDEVLNQVPNMRPNTILTSVMSAQTGQFNTTIWV